ncbi:MAG: VOC family protein [Cyclobacteriaceae bacterium]|nr:VOC family protein [Cyclobacteriaceae bacterium]
MLTKTCPKLPMRNKMITKNFYLNQLGFRPSATDYEGYLMITKDEIEIHFFEFRDLDSKENYGQVYIRTNDIDQEFNEAKSKGINYTKLETKPWGQKEFSILDPDNNLLTFGQSA